MLFRDGRLVFKSRDVGRHNKVDKLVGHAVLNGMDLSRCVIGSTGWQPAGMGRKSAPAGIPVIISLVATPDRGIAQAEAAGLTRVGLARGDSFRIYTYPERILGIHSSSKELNDTQDYFPENRIVKMYMQKGRD